MLRLALEMRFGHLLLVATGQVCAHGPAQLGADGAVLELGELGEAVGVLRLDRARNDLQWFSSNNDILYVACG